MEDRSVKVHEIEFELSFKRGITGKRAKPSDGELANSRIALCDNEPACSDSVADLSASQGLQKDPEHNIYWRQPVAGGEVHAANKYESSDRAENDSSLQQPDAAQEPGHHKGVELDRLERCEQEEWRGRASRQFHGPERNSQLSSNIVALSDANEHCDAYGIVGLLWAVILFDYPVIFAFADLIID